MTAAGGVEGQGADERPVDDPAAAALAEAAEVVGEAVEADPGAWWMRTAQEEPQWED